VELLHRLGLDGEAETELRSYEAVLAKTHESRTAEALCRVYGKLTPAHRRYQVGQRAANWRDLATPPGLDNRWLWECVYPRPYPKVVAAVESEFRLPRHLLHAVMRQESAFSPVVRSPAQAVGLMQIIPPTAARLCRDLKVDCAPELLTQPPHSIRLGGYYLRHLLDMFGGRVALALAAYNAGPQAVSRWLQTGEKLPLDLFVARIPFDETRSYVVRVMGNLARYAHLWSGPESVPKVQLGIPQGLRAPAGAY
jgi:soluble lytic murein transglycosylase